METAVLERPTTFREDFGKIFVIIGKTASGKSSIAKDLSKLLNIEQVLTYTSRPKRHGEVDGVDYHFINESEFDDKPFICLETYYIEPHGYHSYGVDPSSLEGGKNLIIVLTPKGYRELKEKYGDRVFGIYIMAPNKELFTRYISRDPSDIFVVQEARRRIEADEKDFTEFEFEVESLVINNSTYDKALNDAHTTILIEMFQ